MEELKYFFSYARTDSAFVLRLAQELREVGINLWLDQLDILGGQRWDHAVEEALQTCQGMMAVLSPDALASHNVMDEVSYALEERKIVIPLLLRSCTIPFRLRRMQYIDFTADYQTGFSQLLRALRIDQPLQPRAPAVPEDAVIQDVTAPSQETPREVPTHEQLPRRAGPPEPESLYTPGKAKNINMAAGVIMWLVGVPAVVVILLFLFGVI
jgi:TIR domain